MKNFTLTLKRILVVLILLTAIIDTALPTMAMVSPGIDSGQVLPTVNGQYGANLNNQTGAIVTPGQTYANVTTPGTASYLQWNSLNVAGGQTLNYTFLNNGTSFNSVIGGGLSRFAGSLTQTGSGRIVLSNPNGILFENGAMVNANAMTLTTQEIKGFNPVNNTVTWGAYGNGGIQIGQGNLNNAAVMRINNDLTVVAPAGIAIKGADILAGDVKLITSDGVNYYAANEGITNELKANARLTTPQKSVLNVNTNYNSDKQAILVKDSAIAVRDNTTGKIYFSTNNKNANIAVVNSTIDGTIKMDVAGDSSFDLNGNINIADSTVGGELTTLTKGEITLNNTTADSLVAGGSLKNGKLADYSNSITIENNSEFGTVKAFAIDINADASYINGGNLEAINNIIVKNYSELRNTDLIAGDNITIQQSLFKNSSAKATRNIVAEDYSDIANSKLDADGDIYLDTVNLHNNNIASKPSVTAGNTVNIYNSDITKTNIKANNVRIAGTSIVNDSIINATNNINVLDEDTYVNYSKLTAGNNINLENYATVNNSNLTADNNIYIQHSALESSIAKASGNIIARDYSDIYNSDLNAGKNIFFNTVNVHNDKLAFEPTVSAGKKVYIYNSDVTKANIAADNVKISGTSIVNDSIVRASNDITVTDEDTVINYSKLFSGNDINLENYSTVNDSRLVSQNDISIQHSAFEYSSARAGGNITITDYSDIANSRLNATGNISLDTVNMHNDELALEPNVMAGGSVNITNSDVLNANIQAATVNVSATSIVNQSIINALEDITISDNATMVNDSTLSADNDINIENYATVNNSTFNAGNDINVNNYATVNYTALTATNNINVENYSVVDNSNLTAGNDLNISDSTISNMELIAGNNINITDSFAGLEIEAIAQTGDIYINNTVGMKNMENEGSVLATATLNAGNDVIIDGSTLGDTTITAGRDSVINNSTLGNAIINTTRDSNIEESTLEDTTITAGNDSNILDSTLYNTTINATNDSNITSSTLGDITVTAGNDSWITASMGGTTNITAGNDSNINDMSMLGDTTINAGNDSNINSSILANTTINTKNDSNIYSSYLDSAIITAGNDFLANNSVIGDTTINSGRNTNIIDSTLGNTTITAGGNIASIDSTLESGTMNAVGNINLTGIYVTNDLTITGANDVVISNSTGSPDSDYPTIAGLSKGMTSISDYNRTKFNNSTFITEAADLGYGAPAYGAGVRASVIGGNVDISNANSAAIVNTAITGNFAESNILTDASLVYSYVGGNYTPEKSSIGGEASVFETFIKGTYDRTYPDISSNLNEVSKLKYGSQLDTNFKQQFTPKGFAASDDEINTMKRQAISNIVKGKNNSLILNNAFKAY